MLESLTARLGSAKEKLQDSGVADCKDKSSYAGRKIFLERSWGGGGA